MAHLAKYPQCALGHMLNHYARTADDGVKRKNENIKPNLTHKNYNLASEIQPMNLYDFVKKRLTEIKVQKRADVNLVCDWALTAPKDLKEEEYRKFFKTAFEFMANRYGKENVVSAYVHMDETTPHMHFAFVPVVIDKKKKIPKLSAKEATPRADLRTFHNDLSERMKEVFGRDIGILNEATKEGNKAIEDLRRETSRSAIAEQQEKLEIAKAKTAVVEARNVLLEKARKRNELTVTTDESKRYLLWGEERITLSKEDFEKMNYWVNIGLNAGNYVYEAEKVFEQWKKTAENLLTTCEQSEMMDKMRELEKENAKLKLNFDELVEINKNLRNKLTELDKLRNWAVKYEETKELAGTWERCAKKLEKENAILTAKVKELNEYTEYYNNVRKYDVAAFDELCYNYLYKRRKNVNSKQKARSRDDYSR